MARKTSTKALGFEEQIWDAACKLRGNIDASEYKSVVLGLIFLKYISDKFETKYRQLVDEGEGFEEDKDEYTAENIFYSTSRPRPAGRPLPHRHTRLRLVPLSTTPCGPSSARTAA